MRYLFLVFILIVACDTKQERTVNSPELLNIAFSDIISKNSKYFKNYRIYIKKDFNRAFGIESYNDVEGFSFVDSFDKEDFINFVNKKSNQKISIEPSTASSDTVVYFDFSSILINEEHNIAIFYVQHIMSMGTDNAGEGGIYILEKSNDIWKIKDVNYTMTLD
ncbi:MAG: hypothetical protein KDD94_15465 [Calditrichaeota bacterium]|nr:hypothetical protein [Calditrichota bacterium]